MLIFQDDDGPEDKGGPEEKGEPEPGWLPSPQPSRDLEDDVISESSGFSSTTATSDTSPEFITLVSSAVDSQDAETSGSVVSLPDPFAGRQTSFPDPLGYAFVKEQTM